MHSTGYTLHVVLMTWRTPSGCRRLAAAPASGDSLVRGSVTLSRQRVVNVVLSEVVGPGLWLRSPQTTARSGRAAVAHGSPGPP